MKSELLKKIKTRRIVSKSSNKKQQLSSLLLLQQNLDVGFRPAALLSRSTTTAHYKMGSSWTRQYEVLLNKNFKLLLRRPFHLVILLLSSVLSVIFAWLAGGDARGPTGDFPPLTNCGKVDPLYYADITKDNNYQAGQNIPSSLNEPWRGGMPVWLMSLGPTFAAISVFWILRDELNSRRWVSMVFCG